MASTITYGVLFTLGLLFWGLMPTILFRVLSREKQYIGHKLLQFNFSLAFDTVQRGLLVDLTHTGYELVRSKYNADWKLEETKIHSKTQYYTDRAHQMLRAYKADLGVTVEDTIGIFRPKFAEIAEEEYKKFENDEMYKTERKREMQKQGSKKVKKTVEKKEVPNTTVELSKNYRLLDFSYVPLVLRKHIEPQDPDIVGEWVKESQSRFGNINAWDAAIILSMFALSAGVVWFVSGNSSSGGFSGPSLTVPMISPLTDLVVMIL